LNDYINKIDIHTKEVYIKSFSALLVKSIGLVAGLILSIMIARTIGPAGLGIINLSNRIISILLILGMFGFGQVIIKEIAIATNNNNDLYIGSVLYTTYWFNGILITLISTVIIYLAPWIASYIFKEPKLTFTLIVFSLAMIPQLFSMILSSALIGTRRIWQGSLFDQSLSLIITGIIVGIILFINKIVTINIIALCYAASRFSVMLISVLYWKYVFKNNLKKRVINKSLIKTSFPIFVARISAILNKNISIIMLGLLSNVSNVGLFSVASRIALLNSIFLQVINSTISPKIATLYDDNNKKELKKMVRRITNLLIMIGLVTTVIFITFGKTILSIWGNEFNSTYSLLVILSIGQIFNFSSGPVGSLLVMSGHEKILRNINLITVMISIIFNYIFIMYFGILGAAYATAIAVAIKMILCTIYVYRKIGFIPFWNYSK